MLEAPILILLAPASPALGAANGPRRPDGDLVILGLGLIQRTVLTARRAGLKRIFLLDEDSRSAAGLAAVADWQSVAATLASARTAPLIIAPAAILTEKDWLEQLASTRIEPAGWATIPGRIVMLPAASALNASNALDGARD